MAHKSHIHKYILRPTDSRDVWTCALPDCNHFMPAHLTSLVEGKYSICWSCDAKFVLTSEAMKEKQPRCDDCRLGVRKDDIGEFFASHPGPAAE